MKTTLLTIVVGVCLMLSSHARAGIQTKMIEYKHGDLVLEGYLAWDDAAVGKRPGILVVHEWWGLNEYPKLRARKLAELGYVAFACDMYGKGVVTKDPGEAGKLAGEVRKDVKVYRERTAAGLKVLAEQPQVDASKLGAIGYCFGGTAVLNLACHGADVKAVVSFHGSLFKPTPEDAKAVKGSILICNGAADTFIQKDDREALVAAFEKGKVDYQFVDYAGALHTFTNPDSATLGVPGLKYDEKADKRSWDHMQRLFKEKFGE